MIKLTDLYKDLYNKHEVDKSIEELMKKGEPNKLLLGILIEEIKKVETGIQATFLLKIVVEKYNALKDKYQEPKIKEFISMIETLFTNILEAEVDERLFNENTTDNKDGKQST